MKTKIAGLVLIVMGIAMAVITKILFTSPEPEYVPESGIWLQIFRISIFLAAGLVLGIFFGLLVNLTIGPVIVCSLVGFIIGLLAGLFCLTGQISILKILIVSGTVISFPLSGILFLLDGIGFMFFNTYLIDP